MPADHVPLSDMPPGTVNSIIHVYMFIYSNARFCKVLFYRARYLVCYKPSDMPVCIGKGPAPSILYNF